MASKRRVYWDACMWIALIKQEAGRFPACRHTLDLAENNKIELWTSAFTLAEVYKRKVDGGWISIEEGKDKEFEDYIEREFIQVVQVDMEIGKAARRLLRAYPEIGKPQDAVHVTTALLNDLDELHTFDRQDLLDLNGVPDRLDGIKLIICNPPPPPAPSVAPPGLFDSLEQKADPHPSTAAKEG